MEKATRIPIIGVMGSGSHDYAERTIPLGKWIAEQGFHLLSGGGGGVMTAVSQSFCQVSPRKGLSIGIIPGETTVNGYNPLAGYPNPWIEIPVFTHLPMSGSEGMSTYSRNHINILTAHCIVALPGRYGTKSEIQLALRYNKPVLGFFRDANHIFGKELTVECINNFDALTRRITEIVGL